MLFDTSRHASAAARSVGHTDASDEPIREAFGTAKYYEPIFEREATVRAPRLDAALTG